MKIILILILFGLSSSFSLIAQINVKFTDEKSNLEFEQNIDTVEGQTRQSIDIEIDVKTRVTQDYLIKVTIEDLTTKQGEIKLITEAFTLSQTELNTPGIIKRKIEFEIVNADSTSSSKVAKVLLQINGLEFNEEYHERIITLTPKKAKSELESTNELFIKALEPADSVDISSMKLLVNKKGESKFIIGKRKDSDSTNCQYKKGEEYCFRVSEVKVYFDEGRISRIIVIPANLNGYFETHYPISATSFHRRTLDRILYEGPEKCLKGVYIPVGSILIYLGLSSRKRFPPNGTILLTPKEPIKTLNYKRNPLNFFDIRAYTDPLGLNGTANGLVQTEANAHFIFNTQNWKYATLLSSFKIGLGFSRFDSKFDTLSFNSLNNRFDNDLLKIQQQANLNFAFELDLIKFTRVHDYSLSAGHHLSLTNLNDTTSKFIRAVTPSFFGAYNMTLYATPWIQLDVKLPFYMTYLHDNVFQDYTKKWDFFIVPELEIRIRPARVKNPNKASNISVFARAKYFDMINSKGNNFLQLQTGVSISLKDLFK
ncbi:hypothetical protein N9F08_00115 [bacterium]|nr:hypothetical protein [bacterium]